MEYRTRFVGKYFVDVDGCWIWTAAKTSNGYPQVWDGERMALAHRKSYEENVGPIREGMEVDHTCSRHLCINPKHLEEVTHAENVKRYLATITHCKQGHTYDEANTVWRIDKRGYNRRRCRECHRLSSETRNRRIAAEKHLKSQEV